MPKAAKSNSTKPSRRRPSLRSPRSFAERIAGRRLSLDDRLRITRNVMVEYGRKLDRVSKKRDEVKAICMAAWDELGRLMAAQERAAAAA